MKKCPFCAEEIQDEAIICRFCRQVLNPEKVSEMNSRFGIDIELMYANSISRASEERHLIPKLDVPQLLEKMTNFISDYLLLLSNADEADEPLISNITNYHLMAVELEKKRPGAYTTFLQEKILMDGGQLLPRSRFDSQVREWIDKYGKYELVWPDSRPIGANEAHRVSEGFPLENKYSRPDYSVHESLDSRIKDRGEPISNFLQQGCAVGFYRLIFVFGILFILALIGQMLGSCQ